MASPEDRDQILPLLEGYRAFYGQDHDSERSRAFLEERLRKLDSVIFIAREDTRTAGFTQLYPSFSTVRLRPLYILNDLFVLPEYRGKGMGRALLKEAQGYCVEKGFLGLGLETARDNPARYLYDAMGWEKDTHCFHYFWTAPQKSES